MKSRATKSPTSPVRGVYYGVGLSADRYQMVFAVDSTGCEIARIALTPERSAVAVIDGLWDLLDAVDPVVAKRQLTLLPSGTACARSALS